jgi:hypothetical protein
VPAHTPRMPLYAAGLTVIAAAALTACGSGAGAAPSASGTSAASAASASPLAAVRLAAQTSGSVSSFTGTMSLRTTAAGGGTGSGGTSLSASFTERLKPSLLAQVNVESISAAGSQLPGGMTELLTPGTLYLKWSYLATLLHTTKPWVEIPLSTLGHSSGINLSQLFGQASSSSPLAVSQLLGGATSVREVGPGTIDGVAVTEYTGKLSLAQGIKYLSASARSTVQKAFSQAGITTAVFTVWIDGKNLVRKAVITENGTSVSQTITTTITSVNQPVNVAIPAASQTAALPSGSL